MTVTDQKPRTRRGTELVLLIFAIAVVLLAYANVGLAMEGSLPVDLLPIAGPLLDLVPGDRQRVRDELPIVPVQPLQQILQSIEGPVAKIIAVIIIIVTGLTLAFGDTSGGFRRLIQIVFGLSIAFAASSFFLSFFSFGGGALV